MNTFMLRACVQWLLSMYNNAKHARFLDSYWSAFNAVHTAFFFFFFFNFLNLPINSRDTTHHSPMHGSLCWLLCCHLIMCTHPFLSPSDVIVTRIQRKPIQVGFLHLISMNSWVSNRDLHGVLRMHAQAPICAGLHTSSVIFMNDDIESLMWNLMFT